MVRSRSGQLQLLDVFVQDLTANSRTSTKKKRDDPLNGSLIDNRHIPLALAPEEPASFHVRVCTTDDNKHAAAAGTGSISCLFDVINGEHSFEYFSFSVLLFFCKEKAKKKNRSRCVRASRLFLLVSTTRESNEEETVMSTALSCVYQEKSKCRRLPFSSNFSRIQCLFSSSVTTSSCQWT